MKMSVKRFVDSYIVAWASHDVEKIVSYFTDDCVYEGVAFGVVNRGKEEKLQILIIKFLISLSICAFASMQAKALTCTCTGSCRLTSVKGLTGEVKE
jgi:hypothetical protein